MGCESCQKTSSCVSSPGAAASFKVCPPPVAQGPPWAAVWLFSLLWSSIGCRGTTCFMVVLSTGCRGISAPAPVASPPWCLQGCFSYLFLSPLSQLLYSMFLPSHVSTETTNLAERLSFGQQWIHFGASWKQPSLNQKQLWSLLTEATPTAPLHPSVPAPSH